MNMDTSEELLYVTNCLCTSDGDQPLCCYDPDVATALACHGFHGVIGSGGLYEFVSSNFPGVSEREDFSVFVQSLKRIGEEQSSLYLLEALDLLPQSFWRLPQTKREDWLWNDSDQGLTHLSPEFV